MAKTAIKKLNIKNIGYEIAFIKLLFILSSSSKRRFNTFIFNAKLPFFCPKSKNDLISGFILKFSNSKAILFELENEFFIVCKKAKIFLSFLFFISISRAVFKSIFD